MEIRPLNLASGLLAGICLLAGCESSGEKPDGKQPDSNVQQTQDAALRDPFSYGPTEHTKGAKPPSDQKKRDDGTIKSDWDRFWNP